MATTLRFDHVKSRKEHNCELCGLRIRKGATCFSWAISDEYDGFHAGYYHEVCNDHLSDWDETDMECCCGDYAAFRHEELEMTGFLKMSRAIKGK